VTVSDLPLSTVSDGRTKAKAPALLAVAHTIAAACNCFVDKFSCSPQPGTTQWLEVCCPRTGSSASIQDEPARNGLWVVASCGTRIFAAAWNVTKTPTFQGECSRGMLTEHHEININMLCASHATLAIEIVA
jgi:hypothetical protein